MPGRFFRVRTFAPAVVVALAASFGSAAGQDRPAAKVYVEFEGGLIGTEMAGVIDALSGGKWQILPTRLHVPAETVGLCPILEEQLKVAPEFCTADLLAAIRSLNEREGVKLNPDAVNAKTGVFLPAVTATETSVPRLYNLSNQAERARLNELLGSPAWKDVIQDKVDDVLAGVPAKGKRRNMPKIVQLTIKRIGWQIDIEGPEALSQADYVARQLSNRNLTVSVERSEGFAKARHSYSAPDHLAKWCGPPAPAQPPEAEGGYAEMAGHLYETGDVVTCEAEGLRPEVAIMDQKVMRHPDLAQALEQTPAASAQPLALEKNCVERTFDRERHHGTLLASIVASNDNKYGFRGMSPNARLVEIPWNTNENQESELETSIVKNWKPTEPQVFLLASEFAPYPRPPEPTAIEETRDTWKKTWQLGNDGRWIGLLADEHVRKRNRLVNQIFASKILLVASAGQTFDDSEGRPIDWETPMSPQNLGDYESILIVGACTQCAKPNATLWRKSFRGVAESNVVSLLAPGGEEVPTYISDREVSRTIGGTSAAAAFTAGLAAKMAACYPSHYAVQPENLKERIILASRPIAGADRKWLNLVAGGVLDPSVSMLDPGKTWLKLNDPPVKAVEFGHWCARSLDLQDDDTGARDPLNLFAMRRLTTVGSTEIVGQSVSNVPDDHPSLLRKRIVRRKPPGQPVSPEGRVAAVRYEGQEQLCAVALNRMTDLFLAEQSKALGDCETLPLCE